MRRGADQSRRPFFRLSPKGSPRERYWGSAHGLAAEEEGGADLC